MKEKDNMSNEKTQLFKFKSIFKKRRKATSLNKDTIKIDELKKSDKTDKKLNKNIDPKTGKKKNKKLGWKIFKIAIITIIILSIVGAGIVFGIVSGVIDNTESIELEELQLLKLTSFVYDKDGNEIGNLYDSENRVTVEYKNLPTHLVDAVIAIEDERFFTHNGVDAKRTLGAIFSFAANGGDSNFGGSTITQQLVKNITSDKEVSWVRKIREWYRAMSLETKLTKEQILETYLNTIYLGDGSYGVEVASKNYFAKSVKEINIAEAAVIAAVIQTPESTNPYKSEEAKVRLLARKDLVLDQMYKLGKITKEQYDEAKAYVIEFKKGVLSAGDNIQSYFVDAVIEDVIADLQEQKNVTRGVAIKMLYSDGYKIYSTQDSSVQKAIDEAYNNDKLFYTDAKGDFMQSSMVVMDQYTGNVVGLIGGADDKTGTLTLNRATQTFRQPGSTMKPLGAYGPAFELGLVSPGTGLDDSQFTLGNWTPGNYYGYFNGFVTAREAIAKSMNIPAVRACQKAGVDNAYLFAKNAGLVDLVDQDKNLASMALGGVTKGFTVMEMANAYSTIANGGIHMTPKLYSKVLDKNGKEVLVQDTTAKRVMKDSTAFMLTDALQTVVYAGTATGSVRVGNMPVAGKTGNTNDDYDQWFIGFTPYYTIACWNGYDVNRSIGYRNSVGAYPYTSIVLFNTVMNKINANKEIKYFEKPASVTKAAVCRDSGLVATEACTKDPRGDRTITDYFASGTVPTAKCSVHTSSTICNVSGKIATKFCTSTTSKTFLTRPYVPNIKPRDWLYMLPTDTCDIHTKEPVVDIYTDKDKDKTTTTTTTTNTTVTPKN